MKLLIAYSTLAQIGYLFLMFPLAFDAATGALVRGDALTGGLLQAISHATAKAAMFMAAGLIYKAYGHDRIAELGGAVRAVPLSVLAFVIGGVALMGVLPSGAYLAKKLLEAAAGTTGQWWWDWVLTAGGFLTASYVVLVAMCTFRSRDPGAPAPARVPRVQEIAALFLALCSFALALLATWGPLPATLVGSPFAPKELWSTLVTIAVGTALALTISRKRLGASGVARGGDGPRACADAGARRRAEGIDPVLRRWPVAGVSLLVIALAFGLAMRAG